MNVLISNPTRVVGNCQNPRIQGPSAGVDSYAGTCEPGTDLIRPDYRLLQTRSVSHQLQEQALQARAGDPEAIDAFFQASKSVDGSVAESYANLAAEWALQDGPAFVDGLSQASRDCWGASLELVRYADKGALIGLSAGRPDGSGRPDGALAETYGTVLSEAAAQDPLSFITELGQQNRAAWRSALDYISYADPGALIGLAQGRPDGALAELYAGKLAESALADPAFFVKSMEGASRDSWSQVLRFVRYASPQAYQGLAGYVDGAIAEIYHQPLQ